MIIGAKQLLKALPLLLGQRMIQEIAIELLRREGPDLASQGVQRLLLGILPLDRRPAELQLRDQILHDHVAGK